jgi:hypothetical protein
LGYGTLEEKNLESRSQHPVPGIQVEESDSHFMEHTYAPETVEADIQSTE